jgi:hypothetical protein
MESNRLAKLALPYAFVTVITFSAASASAQADAGAMDGGGTDDAATASALAATDFTFFVERFDILTNTWVVLSPTEQAYFFDRARCECVGDTRSFTGWVKIAIQPSAAAVSKIQSLLAANQLGSGTARLYAGSSLVNCLTPTSLTAGAASDWCLNLLDPSSYTASIPGGMALFATLRVWESPPIPIAWLFGATWMPVCKGPPSCNETSTCANTLATADIYFWAQTSAADLPDRNDLAFSINLAGHLNLAPPHVTVESANQALVVNWEWPTGQEPAANPSILGVQVFCQRGQGATVFPPGTYAPAFARSANLCPDAAPAASSPAAFNDLDPAYLCSGLLPATATSYRISGLQNDLPYGVAVAVVDKYGNVSAIAPAQIVDQAPSASAVSPDGGIDGGRHAGGSGGCSLARGHGATEAPTVLALLALGIPVLGRRRARSLTDRG